MSVVDILLYRLPSHPALVSADPLGVCDGESPSWWDVITRHIKDVQESDGSSLGKLPGLIEDLGYSLHGNGKVDTGFLRQFIHHHIPPGDRTRLLDVILEHAVSLPVMFPSHTLQQLSIHSPFIEFSDGQVKALLSHQLLGTLLPPNGNTWGCTFLPWYQTSQPMPNAVEGYLTATFYYFLNSYPSAQFKWCASPLGHPWAPSQARLFHHVTFNRVALSDVEFPLNARYCSLISSHSSPGFGTSCTQEELVTAACPALLVLGALLVTPPIPADTALLARNVVPTAQWKGQGREARLVQLLNAPETRSFIFADALELDLIDGDLPDLLPGNVERELNKLFAGFSRLANDGVLDVASPLWGSGAFGGNPIVKVMIMAMAAAQTGINIDVTVDQDRLEPAHGVNSPDGTLLVELLESLRKSCKNMTVSEAYAFLTSPEARGCLNGEQLVRLIAS
ncbi:hypothetical protein BDN72DRAFT_829965 [Pluteus cervinus]|uniref:Uncharacterized protein n=1 Tax=Pluteus cervinus TaxID=181527 RepID=A0ACD3BGK1_9AGAR|nr:hypothetical protein BDN72DRAFT_829965 [Pluteus cervinus]